MAKRFQTKDLMISLRGEEAAAGERRFCPPGSACDPTIHCPGGSIQCRWSLLPCDRFTIQPCGPLSGCGLNYSMCWGGTGWDTPRVQPGQLGQPGGRSFQSLEDVQALRQELQTTLAQLDEVEAELSGPRSVEEAEELESKLEDALKELKARKKTLGKRG